jgi:hypothetical protein
MALDWLSSHDRDWVSRNRYFLDAVWSRFWENGDWPDPVDVLRELRAADPNRRVNAALAEMPAALGRREYAPPRLILSIFGIACCSEAQVLLRQYRDVSRLALRRFDSPGLPNRLTRADVVAELRLNETDADRLSQVLMSDAPFLGSGESTIASWDREVDPRAEEFDGLNDTEALISFLADQRQIAVERHWGTEAPTAADSEPGDWHTSVSFWATVLSALATVSTFVLTVLRPPSFLGVAILGGLIGLTVGLLWRRSRRALVIVAVLIGAGLGVAAGVLFVQPPSHGPYRYFVASTGNAAVIIGSIEPRHGAAQAQDTVLGLGDSTPVNCLRRRGGELWAQLPNGSFVPADLLTVEVGGHPAPSC